MKQQVELIGGPECGNFATVSDPLSYGGVFRIQYVREGKFLTTTYKVEYPKCDKAIWSPMSNATT